MEDVRGTLGQIFTGFTLYFLISLLSYHILFLFSILNVYLPSLSGAVKPFNRCVRNALIIQTKGSKMDNTNKSILGARKWKS